MHNNILTDEQRKLLPLIKTFSKDYYLVGGTAIALHIGHRRSIDFDLFTGNDIKRRSIRNRIEKDGLYFVLKDYHDLRKISSKATEIFGNSFNSKLFREQLCYFDDIDYSEKVEYVGEEVDDETIKIFLTDIATKPFE